MRLTFTGCFEIDFEKERARLNKCFAGKTLKRQLKIIKLFEQGKFKECGEFYESLPYNKKHGCPEQEYVGLWFCDVIDSLMYAKFSYKDLKIING